MKPNLTARRNLDKVAAAAKSLDMPPFEISTSVEGGIAVCFVAESRYADIECFNTGEALAVVSDRITRPKAWEVSLTEVGLREALLTIRDFLKGTAMEQAEQPGTKPESTHERLSIGTGRLTWDRSERISDRYGAIYLIDHGDSLSSGPTPYSELNIPQEWKGRRVRITARVLESRDSTHIGDMFHGVYPRTPAVGESILLGEGYLRAGLNRDNSMTVELVPLDGESRRYRLRGLYDAHEQTVELIADGWREGKE